MKKNFEINKKHWLAIAASVVLVAVVSIVFYILPQDAPEMIAEEKLQEQPSLPLIDTTSGEVEQLDTVFTETQHRFPGR